jgi:uncharacterized metal-binding protein YceD (DUF177 family)
MTESPLSSSAPPFSRPLAAASVGEAGQRLHHAASEAECAALAELDGLVGVRDLAVDAEVSRRGKDGLHVSGRVTALVTQTCVVTLEPFESQVDERFEVDFAPEAEAEAAHRRALEEIEAAADKAAALLEQRDPPDPIVGGQIDLGALAMEFLALGLDPYPRSPGARFDEVAEPEKASPFTVLAALKKD